MLNLQEQQKHLQHQLLLISDQGNMEKLKVEEHPVQRPNKYVSVFHINGEPILPPLMTAEKRKQMQNLKEKALSVENRIKDRKQREQTENKQIDTDENTEHKNPTESKSTLSTGESKIVIRDLEQKPTGETEYKIEVSASNTPTYTPRCINQDKLKKLQKSEILIYDNSTNEVIQVPAEKNRKMPLNLQRKSEDEECQTNFLVNTKSSHLLLDGINSRGSTSIPSICLNPPTPLAISKSLCDTLSGADSSESDNQNKPIEFDRGQSSDESYNSMITQSDKKLNRTKAQNKDRSGTKLEMCNINHANSVPEKVKKFEAFSSDYSSSLTSPEKKSPSRKSCLETPNSSFNRSATSPSLKLSSSARSSSSKSQDFAQGSPEKSLVRSSSFTLEEPSKALIKHMKLQKENGLGQVLIKTPLNTSFASSKKLTNSPRAYRDTIESKAKKVQKVEPKSSKQKIQLKSSLSKLASSSPYSSSSLCKMRSPCDISDPSPIALQKSSSTTMRKTNSSSLTTTPQTRSCKSKLPSNSPTPSSSVSCSSARTPLYSKESFNQMAKAQKEKFLQLLAQQDEEHKRMQQSFELQQKLLIDKLNREMASNALKSANNLKNSSTISPTLQQKKLNGHHALSPTQQQRPLNSIDHSTQRPSSSPFELKSNQTQRSPFSVSNNNTFGSNDRSQLQTLNSQNASHIPQSPKSSTINHSPLTLLDHSNANTSLGISMPTTPTMSIATHSYANGLQNITAPSHNNVFSNPTTPSSRRRLFPTEMNTMAAPPHPLRTTRSTPKSPYTSVQAFVGHGQQLDPSNRSRPLTNEIPRRLCDENDNDSVLLHAAATKINAYARGYLVRRLFQTEQIQSIVRTIRDTLIFVINLHLETIENPEESHTPANIKLKARLLQQLSSACRTLHLFFFQTSIKERMEIIARDRKRIKTKLLLMNSKRTMKTIEG